MTGIKIQIYQFAKKVIRSLRKQKNIIQIKIVCPLIEIIPVIKAPFRKKIIDRWLRCEEVRFMLNSLFNNIDQGKKFLTSLPTNYLINTEGLFGKLGELQKEKIKRTLDLNRKTVALCFSSAAYREQAGNIANRLRSKGHNVITLTGTVGNDQYEKQQKCVYYGGNGIINGLDFINVAIEVSPTPDRPRKAKKVHFVHDIYDSPMGDVRNMDAFSRYMLKCDYLFLPSHYVVERFKQLIFQARGKFSKEIVKGKPLCLIPGGYIKLDRNLQYFDKHSQETKTLIYAPTVTETRRGGMGDVTSACFGDKIIEAILNHFKDYDLIFRPHPHALDTRVVQNIAKKYGSHPRFIFDDNPSFYMENYSKSALMITDMSGTAYTYAFTTLRPVIFFSHNENKTKKRFKGLKYFEDRSKVGCTVKNVEEMTDKIKLMLTTKDESRARIKEYRDSLIYNIGKAENYFIDNFDYIIEDKKHPDWVYL